MWNKFEIDFINNIDKLEDKAYDAESFDVADELEVIKRETLQYFVDLRPHFMEKNDKSFSLLGANSIPTQTQERIKEIEKTL
ncbi:hypothetical protein CMK19_00635 [Candidatus Poribacteria bacterium]|nr:hypothetical protein [Candidatus Poribacteria bacterium]|tara:strand:+ start:600 stop:845 length:246 start_codon:yes stop_codon:yes gene_type:complete